jgi:hypothetical protein
MVMDSLGGGFRILRKRSNLCTRARHKVVEAVPVPEVGREVGASRRLAVTPSHPVTALRELRPALSRRLIAL